MSDVLMKVLRLIPVQIEDPYEQMPERERMHIYYRYFLNITNNGPAPARRKQRGLLQGRV